MKIVADENIPYLKGWAETFGETTYLSGASFNKDTIKDADVLIVRTVTHFNKDILNGSSVKLICSATIGYDHIDTQYCDNNGIKWTNAPGCNSSSVQQYVVSSLILLSRKYNFNLQDKTIGVVGVGNVGKKVAQACQQLGMKVLLNDPPRQQAEQSSQFVTLNTIQNEADIITFHTPLSKGGEFRTHHLADKAFFHSLANTPFIINSARGAIVDTTAIMQALDSHKIKGAVIDCWENEPNINQNYLSRADIATPHIAGYSADGKSNATRMSLESIAKFYSLDNTTLKDIKPLDIPNSIIDLSKYTNSENRVHDAILATYNPIHDFQMFKSDISKYKQLRNDYPLRREYPAYSIINANKEEQTLLKSLGFATI